MAKFTVARFAMTEFTVVKFVMTEFTMTRFAMVEFMVLDLFAMTSWLPKFGSATT